MAVDSPAAPGPGVQVFARSCPGVMDADDWCCGRWASEWWAECGGSGGALRRWARCLDPARRHSPCWALGPLRSAELAGGNRGEEGKDEMKAK